MQAWFIENESRNFEEAEEDQVLRQQFLSSDEVLVSFFFELSERLLSSSSSEKRLDQIGFTSGLEKMSQPVS